MLSAALWCRATAAMFVSSVRSSALRGIESLRRCSRLHAAFTRLVWSTAFRRVNRPEGIRSSARDNKMPRGLA